MKIEPVVNNEGKTVGYTAYCLGCKCRHMIHVEGAVKWKFDGNQEKPTFSPSLMVNKGHANPEYPQCHSFIRNGQWQYLKDCTHDLAGKTVDMIDMTEDDW